ncbi:PREDICTED: uncharacterized protein LOC106751160 [Dinoponera quadriceps]|uniref:Uncharacterized protein LOC106751160 n=1 Tax=Dinoponera quadriceps TaxID=609295 RepID=A0A6P3YC83_DINQU|nr:PREDICTED: uncharacterized protein LOC106751160 [Dinoponera quadriceps]
MIVQANYDIHPMYKLSRVVFSLLGIWPYASTNSWLLEKLKRTVLLLGLYFLLGFDLIPMLLYVFLVQNETRVKLKVMASIIFTIVSIFKYSNLLYLKNQVRNCLTRVEQDFRSVISPTARETMLFHARTGRFLCILSCIITYSTSIAYRVFIPLSHGKIVTPENITIRPLPLVAHFVVFDPQPSPVYEIVFFVQFFTSLVKSTIAVATCCIASLFAMHIVAQLEILTATMNNLTCEHKDGNVSGELSIIVEHQIKTQDLVHMVQGVIHYWSLLEIITSSFLICFISYHLLMEWEASNGIATFAYIITISSFIFYIFLYCFIGEQLSEKAEQVALTACTLDWYVLPDTKARALILLMIMSNTPLKLKAGSFMDLSFRTFGLIVKKADCVVTLILGTFTVPTQKRFVMFANANYERDINYTYRLNRFVFSMLGIWPYAQTNFWLLQKLKRTVLLLGFYFLLCCDLISMLLYIFMVQKETRVKLKVMAAVIYSIVTIFKYSNLVYIKNRVRNCLTRVEEDFRSVASSSARKTMLLHAKIGRHLFILCSAFMYSAGMAYRAVIPLSKGKIVTAENITIRPLPCAAHFIVFDPQTSPAYEIVFFAQCFTAFIKNTITVAACGIAALFTMHTVAQLEILMTAMNNLTNKHKLGNVNRELSIIVEHQIKTRQ